MSTLLRPEAGSTCPGLLRIRQVFRVPSVVKGWNVFRVPPRVRLISSSEVICFDVLTKLVVASSDELGRGLWPGRRDGLFRCVGWRSSPWLVGLPPGEVRYMVPRSGSLEFAGGGPHLFMNWGSGDDMTSEISPKSAPGVRLTARPQEPRPEVCPAKEVRTVSTLTSPLSKAECAWARCQVGPPTRRLRMPLRGCKRCLQRVKNRAGHLGTSRPPPVY